MNFKTIALAGLSALALQTGCSKIEPHKENIDFQALLTIITSIKNNCRKQYSELESLREIRNTKHNRRLRMLRNEDIRRRGSIEEVKDQIIQENSAINEAIGNLLFDQICTDELREEICAIPSLENFTQLFEYRNSESDKILNLEVLSTPQRFCVLNKRENT